MSPEETLFREIEAADAELTPAHPAKAMARLSPVQMRRLRARYALNKKLRGIAADEGIGGSCASASVSGAVKKLQGFFIKNDRMPKEA